MAVKQVFKTFIVTNNCQRYFKRHNELTSSMEYSTLFYKADCVAYIRSVTLAGGDWPIIWLGLSPQGNMVVGMENTMFGDIYI